MVHTHTTLRGTSPSSAAAQLRHSPWLSASTLRCPPRQPGAGSAGAQPHLSAHSHLHHATDLHYRHQSCSPSRRHPPRWWRCAGAARRSGRRAPSPPAVHGTTQPHCLRVVKLARAHAEATRLPSHAPTTLPSQRCRQANQRCRLQLTEGASGRLSAARMPPCCAAHACTRCMKEHAMSATMQPRVGF